MTEPVDEPRDDLDIALAGLRETIHRGVSGPDAAALRARAQHQLRVRRITTAGVTTAVVLALALGGNALVQPTTSPPIPPAASPTETPLVAPSPRPSPVPPEPLDDPIVEVDWRNATITIPPREGCPSGVITFGQDPEEHSADWAAFGPSDSYPRIVIDASLRPYGDLTGDGRAEAVLGATCVAGTEDLGDGRRELMVVARTEAGGLQALGWVGRRGAVYHAYWVADGYLYTEAREPGSREPGSQVGEDVDAAPGAALRYRWDGAGFSDPELAPEYRPIVPVTDGGSAAPVRPTAAVASWFGCPDAELRFTFGEPSFQGDLPVREYSATGGWATYVITDSASPYLLDLDRTGARLLVLPLACTGADGWTRHGLAVFEPAGDGWRGISVLLTRTVAETAAGPAYGDVPIGWEWTPEGQLWVTWQAADEDRVVAITPYEWTGTVLEQVDG